MGLRIEFLTGIAMAMLLAGCVSNQSPDAPLASSDVGVKCVGHRGDYPDAPEGSHPAYSNAVVRGCDILKLDLQETKDGIPVLSHDPTLTRTMGWSTNITRVTYAEILQHEFKPVGGHEHEKLVSVKEGLAYARQIPEVWLDFKYFKTNFCENVLQLVQEAGISDDRVMCATYNRQALQYMKDKHPGIRRVSHVTLYETNGVFKASFGTKSVCRDLENDMVREILAYRDQLGLYGVNIIAHRAMTPGFIERLKAEGLWFSLALVHTEKAAKFYAPLRPDCVVTRDVRTIRPIFDAAR